MWPAGLGRASSARRAASTAAASLPSNRSKTRSNCAEARSSSAPSSRNRKRAPFGAGVVGGEPDRLQLRLPVAARAVRQPVGSGHSHSAVSSAATRSSLPHSTTARWPGRERAAQQLRQRLVGGRCASGGRSRSRPSPPVICAIRSPTSCLVVVGHQPVEQPHAERGRALRHGRRVLARPGDAGDVEMRPRLAR